MIFDPEQFLNIMVEAPLSTEFVLVPEGEYVGLVDDVKMRKATTKDGERAVCEVFWDIDDPRVQEMTHRKKNTVKQGIFLDLTENGGLDLSPGANVTLGRVRTALKQNNPGQRWTFSMMKGNAARVVVEHSKSGENIFANVTKVAAL